LNVTVRFCAVLVVSVVQDEVVCAPLVSSTAEDPSALGLRQIRTRQRPEPLAWVVTAIHEIATVQFALANVPVILFSLRQQSVVVGALAGCAVVPNVLAARSVP
jgi:hypothetical protein